MAETTGTCVYELQVKIRRACLPIFQVVSCVGEWDASIIAPDTVYPPCVHEPVSERCIAFNPGGTDVVCRCDDILLETMEMVDRNILKSNSKFGDRRNNFNASNSKFEPPNNSSENP